MASLGNQRVKVAVRVRPMLREGAVNQQQEKFELQGVYRVGDNGLKVELTKPDDPVKSSMFTFDYIFDQDSTQLEVYEDAVVEMVDAALVGVNATLLAYGQTGSGKTFTVLGDVKPNPLENDLLTTQSGMFLRVLSDLMDYKTRQAKKGWHVLVGLSCMEIYNESIRDLFGGKPGTPPPPLKAVMIGEDVLLPSLIVKEVTTLQAVFSEIQLAIARRKSRATDSNTQSSRSHCLFSIDVLQQAMSAPAPSLDILDATRKDNDAKKVTDKRNGNGPAASQQPLLQEWEMPFQGSVFRKPHQKEPIYASKVILADLAGSERIARSGVTGDGFTEAASINSSLTALGNVVHSLHEGGFVSYRVSNLTRLLKRTFSHPAARVLLLAQCSPTQLTFDETVSTLYFANKVKNMKVTTSSGAEAEKLQFDFLEAGKLYDTLLADLHIFAVDAQAKTGIIRRRVPRHGRLYYDANASKNNKTVMMSMRERRSSVNAMGAIAAAQNERAAILACQQKGKDEEAATMKRAMEEMRVELLQEHACEMKDLREGVTQQIALQQQHARQHIVLRTMARGNQIMEEGAELLAVMMLRYLQEHKEACEKELKITSHRLEEISRDLNKQKLSTASNELPEITEDDHKYALAAWGHCVGKRFFSRCVELGEEQLIFLGASLNNRALGRWAIRNVALLEKYNASSGTG